MNVDPYDPKKMEIVSAQFAAAWRDLEDKRRELYQYVLGDLAKIRSDLAKQATNPIDRGVARFAADVFDLAAGNDADADQAWTTATGLPPITSLEHLQIVEAAAVREGFNVTIAGLKVIAIRWALRRGAINGRRIFWLCPDCFKLCNPASEPTIGSLPVPAACPLCGKQTDDQRNFAPLFARDVRPPAMPITDQEFAVEEFREYFKSTDAPDGRTD